MSAGWNSGGTLTAHLSDGSATDFTASTVNTSGQYDHNYTLTYNAASAGQTLTVTWKMSSGTGNVTLSGAALSGATAWSGQHQATGERRRARRWGLPLPPLCRPRYGRRQQSGERSCGDFHGAIQRGQWKLQRLLDGDHQSSGVATAPTFTATEAGSYTVTASVAGVATPASFNLTNNDPPSSITATGGTPQSATVGTAFAAALQATVKDAGNNPVSGVAVTFTAPPAGPGEASAAPRQ